MLVVCARLDFTRGREVQAYAKDVAEEVFQTATPATVTRVHLESFQETVLANAMGAFRARIRWNNQATAASAPLDYSLQATLHRAASVPKEATPRNLRPSAQYVKRGSSPGTGLSDALNVQTVHSPQKDRQIAQSVLQESILIPKQLSVIPAYRAIFLWKVLVNVAYVQLATIRDTMHLLV